MIKIPPAEDMFGKRFRVGQEVLKGKRYGSSGAIIERRKVAKIDEYNRVYLESLKLQPLQFPEACVIWSDPE